MLNLANATFSQNHKVAIGKDPLYPKFWEGTKIFCQFFANILTLYAKIRSPLIIT